MPLRILVLGGTQFVGLHLVNAALNHGHLVTLFNRGKTNTSLFPQAERLIGDRHGSLDALRGKTWDAVVDVNGYDPEVVRRSANRLAGNVGRYLFISTIDVYDVGRMPSQANEDAPVKVSEEDYGQSAYGGDKAMYMYGRDKALCEQAVQEVFPGRFAIFRLGWMAGPHNTRHLAYWARRIPGGGELLVPQRPSHPIQSLDARDLADFVLKALDRSLQGIYNTVGEPTTWQDWLDSWRRAAKVEGLTYTWVEYSWLDAELSRQGSSAFEAVPMSISAQQTNFYKVSSDKAVNAGLRHRSLTETFADVLAWDRSLLEESRQRTGLSADQEAQLLRLWHLHAKDRCML